MPEIFSRGELSFVFIDNEFSHAIRKTVAPDNWLAHEFFGGKNEYYQTTANEISWAEIFSKHFAKGMAISCMRGLTLSRIPCVYSS